MSPQPTTPLEAPFAARGAPTAAPHENPFHTRAFAGAMAALGKQPWRLGSDCAGFIVRTRLHRLLELPSLPVLAATDPFWRHLEEFCREHRVTLAEFNTYATSATVVPPPLANECLRQPRVEYVIELADSAWERRIARSHWRSIRRARVAGLRLRRARDAAACGHHVRLLWETRRRFAARGLDVPCDVPRLTHWTTQVLRHGAGELFQACAGDEPLASVLVLRAPRAAYGESSGSTAAARRCCATHFLLHAIAACLRSESVARFYLGGAEENTGLQLFKAHFGATEIYSEAVRIDASGPLRRRLGAWAQRWRA